ncbi:MAG: glycosyltransferase [Blastomonas fulva]|uniref:glycosyltransferase n=1 Tax=Blastomonas fulva TaxID=1550728 RepID=UPI0024E271BF|nr:glycosyltransferase [Blastomonas fulva]MDK2759554.1 glycosyltransferase [Blastomonas fulva]
MASPLRILTFLHSFEPGGVERVALRLVVAWRADGHEAHLVLGRQDGAMAAEWPGLEFEALTQTGRYIRHIETLWMILRLPREIRRIKPDILFCSGNTYAVVAVAMKLWFGQRCPPIVAKISNDLGRRDLPVLARSAYRIWLRLQGRLIDRFVGMASPMADEIASAMHVPVPRVAIVNDPAVSIAQILPLAASQTHSSIARNGTRFVAIGRLVAQKNFGLMIRAFAAVAQAQDRLTIYGEGPERGALSRLVNALGMDTHIALPGHINPVDGALRVNDAFLLSSDYEGVPAVVVEALAHGLPVVATDCSISMASLLDHGRLGMLVKVGSQTDFAQAMCEISSRSFSRSDAQAQARNFTVERAGRAYVAVFRSLANGHSDRPCEPKKVSDSAGVTLPEPRRLN